MNPHAGRSHILGQIGRVYIGAEVEGTRVRPRRCVARVRRRSCFGRGGAVLLGAEAKYLCAGRGLPIFAQPVAERVRLDEA